MDVLLTLAVAIPAGFIGAVVGIWIFEGDNPIEQWRLIRDFWGF